MVGQIVLTLDMACAIAEGREWFGFRVQQTPVVYLALEGEAGFKLRTQAWSEHHGRPLPPQFAMVMQPFEINRPRDVLDLAQVIPLGALTIIDTQNRAYPAADENSSKDMGEILQGAKTIADISKGLVLLIAHTGKDDTKGVRGHSSQLAAMDAAILVRRKGDARAWLLDKCKEGDDGDEYPFKLDIVELGTDEDGDPLTSCVVAQAAARMPRHKPMTKAQRSAIHAYMDACEAGLGLLDDAGRFRGLHSEDWREAFYRTSTADKPGTKQKAFSRVLKDLVTCALATVSDDVYRVITPDATANELFFSTKAGQRTMTGQRPDMSGDIRPDRHGHTPLGVCPG